MKKYKNLSPEESIKAVTVEIIERAIKLGRKKNREIFISKTTGGKGTSVFESIPIQVREEKNSINWRVLNLSFRRRLLLQFQVAVSFFMKGIPFKNKFYRWMGAHIEEGAEIMQLVWLDHFRPELIFIGKNTVLGAFTRLTVHAYEGAGKFRYGLITIGNNCMIGAGTGMGPIDIEDNSRTLPGTTLSPYLSKIKSGSIVGWNPPDVKEPRETE